MPEMRLDTSPMPSDARGSDTPIFTILAGLFALFCLVTPLLLVSLPLMAASALAIIALARRERPRWVAPLVLAFCALMVVGVGVRWTTIDGRSATQLSAAKIDDYSWDVDPTFGDRGTIKWRAVVRNVTDRSIASVRVDFSTYDSSGKLLASTFGYVDAIPARDARTGEFFADLYGKEATARVVVTEVRFADNP